MGVDDEENEIGILEFIHALVETLDRYQLPTCPLAINFVCVCVHFGIIKLCMLSEAVTVMHDVCRYFENVCELDIMTQVGQQCCYEPRSMCECLIVEKTLHPHTHKHSTQQAFLKKYINKMNE